MSEDSMKEIPQPNKSLSRQEAVGRIAGAIASVTPGAAQIGPQAVEAFSKVGPVIVQQAPDFLASAPKLVLSAEAAKPIERKAQAIQNPITFTNPSGQQVDWFFDNARHGMPPNSPNTPTGTVDVSINHNYSASFQTKNSLYPEMSDGSATNTVIGGLLADVSIGKGYMATGVDINNIVYPRIETIRDINNPTDYNNGARTVIKDGIGDIAQNGDYGSFSMGSDNQGKYIDIGFIRSVDPSKNGTYRVRLDTQGLFSGSFSKLPSNKIWIPIAANKSGT